MKIGTHDFRLCCDGIMGGRGWMEKIGRTRLIVRASVVKHGMWCAEQRTGTSGPGVMKRPNGMVRRFKTKEKAMRALVSIYDQAHG